jgi:thiol-disulfide isomerase/thioredoxin
MQTKFMLKSLRILAGLALAGTTLSAGAATLSVGDPAPKIQSGKWIQGDPVTEFKSGTVYIVEFWATWCGPCRQSIPHLNEVYEKFKSKGLVCIGQDVWEETEADVAPFVKKMGDQMTYRVALDDKSKESKGAMAVNWMEAAGQDGIPAAFVIDKHGRIAWIGHPMAMPESMLEKVLADNYDIKAAAEDYRKQHEAESRRMELGQQLQTSMENKDWATASKTVDQLEKVLPESAAPSLGMVRFQILAGQKDYAAAYKIASSLSDSHPDNAALQNAIAWTIATMDGLEKRDLELAEKIADRAVKASDGKNPNVLDTLARIQFMRGDHEKAIATEQKAVDVTPDRAKPMFQKMLDSYKKGELPAVPE